MFSFQNILTFLIITFVCHVESKTLKSKIYTKENGNKELYIGNDGDVDERDIDDVLKLLKELNVTGTNVEIHSGTFYSNKTESDDDDDGDKVSKSNENIFMKHWNTLTEVGWKNFKEPGKNMDLNNARPLTISDNYQIDDDGDHDDKTRTKSGATSERKSRIDNQSIDIDLCREINNYCRDYKINNITECLSKKNKTIFNLLDTEMKNGKNVPRECLSMVKKTMEKPRTVFKSSRTFLRPRIFLHKILLPLLVVIVIKYLITLPFVAVSVFTLNAMWFGFLSWAAAIFPKVNLSERKIQKKRRKIQEPIFPNKK